jgi:hypothetical protein
MELYHASRKEMENGQHIVSTRTSDFYPEASKEMDSARPNGKPARTQALYCSDNPEFAVFYLMLQQVPIEEIKLYKVEVADFHKAPFCITSVVKRRIGKNEEVESLITEYWNPTLDWNYYEFLTLEFTIQEIVDTPLVNEVIIRYRYGNDSNQAQQIS